MRRILLYLFWLFPGLDPFFWVDVYKSTNAKEFVLFLRILFFIGVVCFCAYQVGRNSTDPPPPLEGTEARKARLEEDCLLACSNGGGYAHFVLGDMCVCYILREEPMNDISPLSLDPSP